MKRFEDSEAWQKARELTALIYRLTNQGELRRDFAMRDQMRRAASSVMGNIAEGFERGGNSEFRQFLAIAKGSAGELRSHVHVPLDAGFITQQEFDQPYSACLEASRLIAGLMRYLERSDKRGPKYKTDDT